MSKITFGILSLGIFALGVGTGYYICKKQLEEQYREEIQEIQEMRDRYLLQDEDTEDKEIPDQEFYNPKANSEEQKEAAEHLNRLINQNLYAASEDKGKPIINYNKIKPGLKDIAEKMKKQLEESGLYDPDIGLDEDSEEAEATEEDEEEEEEMDEIIDYDNPNFINEDEPCVIDFDEFKDNILKYEQEALFFYTEDAVLCDEDDNIISEYEDLIGYEWEKVFFKQTNAWVRNDKLKTMYEIHSIPKSYEEEITRFIGTDRERDFNRKARMKNILDR